MTSITVQTIIGYSMIFYKIVEAKNTMTHKIGKLIRQEELEALVNAGVVEVILK